MADPFQPRFVDLVRNLTTTQGTGNFVVGSAVSGFNSFATAVLAGESFYYSAIGIDKPAEREVGRGTMQADGTISRDAISGTLTNFTTGNKSLALIAAAAWFTSIQDSLGLAQGLSVARSNFVPLTSGSGADIVQDGDTSVLTIADSADPWWASAGPLTDDFVVEIEALPEEEFTNWPRIWLSATPADSADAPVGYSFNYGALSRGRGKTVSLYHRPLTSDTVALYGMEAKLFLVRRGALLQYWAGETLETAIMAFEEEFTTDPLYLNVNSAGNWLGGLEGVYRFSTYDAVAFSPLSESVRALVQSFGKHLRFKANNYYPDFRARLYINSQFNPEGDDTWVRFQNTPTILPDHSPYFARFYHKGNEWQMGQINAATSRVQFGITAGAWEGTEFLGNELAHVLGGVDAFRSDADGIAVNKRLNLAAYVNAAPAAGDVWWTQDATYGEGLAFNGSVIASGETFVARSPFVTGGVRLETTAGNASLRSVSGVAILAAQGVSYVGWQELRLRGASVTFHTNGTLRGTLSDTGLSLTGTISASNLSGTNTGDQFTSMTASRLLGRVTAGFGAAEELTGTQATALLDVFTSTAKGLAPASGGGTANFLRADGSWAAPPSGGGGLSDGDKGDVVVSGSGATWTVESAAGNFAVTGALTLPVGIWSVKDSGGQDRLFFTSGSHTYHKSAADHIWRTGNSNTDRMTLSDAGLAITGVAVDEFTINSGSGFVGALISRRSDAPSTSAGIYFDSDAAGGNPALRSDAGALGIYTGATKGSAGGTLRASIGPTGLSITGNLDATGTAAAANLSGTNTGDQTITLTGDVTGSGSGSFAATIGTNKVTFAKIVAATGASILGATAAGNFAQLTPAQARAVTGVLMAVGFHCAGKPTANEVIGGVISPYAFTISQANSAVKALVAATASTVITIKKNGTQIGTATFAAAGTSATLSITTTGVAGGDHITFHAPATADSTLADIDGLLKE